MGSFHKDLLISLTVSLNKSNLDCMSTVLIIVLIHKRFAIQVFIWWLTYLEQVDRRQKSSVLSDVLQALEFIGRKNPISILPQKDT